MYKRSKNGEIEGVKLKPDALGHSAVVDGFMLLDGPEKKSSAQYYGVEVGMVLKRINSTDVSNMDHKKVLSMIADMSKAPFFLQFENAVSNILPF